MVHIANDNSDDIATNLFKRVKVVKNHYYTQRFRARLLDRVERFTLDPSANNQRLLNRAMEDFSAYQNAGEVHPLDQEI